MKGFKKHFKKYVGVVMTVVAVIAMSCLCFAVEPGSEVTTFDVVSTVSSSFSGVVNTLLAILAAVVGSAMIIIGAKIGITKGIQFFKTLAGKA